MNSKQNRFADLEKEIKKSEDVEDLVFVLAAINSRADEYGIEPEASEDYEKASDLYYEILRVAEKMIFASKDLSALCENLNGYRSLCEDHVDFLSFRDRKGDIHDLELSSLPGYVDDETEEKIYQETGFDGIWSCDYEGYLQVDYGHWSIRDWEREYPEVLEITRKNKRNHK